MKYKGCIMEVRESTMIVMTTDCGFRKIKKKNNAYEGMEIEFDSGDMILDKKKTLAQFCAVAVAVLLIMITSVYGFQYWNLSNQSIALVTIDINPSLQLEVNYKNEVIKASALNQDAKKLPLEDLKRKSLPIALEILLEQAKEKGYIIQEEENYILVTTVVLQQEKADVIEIKRILQEAKENIEDRALKEGDKIEIIAIDASEDMLLKAKEQKISVGRLQIYEEVKESNKEKLNGHIIQGMKIKELIEMRKEAKSEKKHPVFDNHPSEKEDDKVKNEEKKEHPVFDDHPSEKKDDKVKNEKKKEHPVFDNHPSEKEDDKVKNEEKKEHPVFDDHPSEKKDDKVKNGEEKEHPVFDNHPSEKKDDKVKNGEEKEHPVFDNHPSEKKDDKVKNGEEKEHPVFDNHPSEKKDDEVKNEEEKEHPVFDNHPSNSKNDNDSDEVQKQTPVIDESPSNNKNNKDKDKQDKESSITNEQSNKTKQNNKDSKE
ncbi:Anti-sigma factor N-terminus [Anaerovirgula multivorans]|uniref:Anti-sigma factor N-terminus n=1 Tax=Anaerovirgula multivorans TaxID=312168 RepID=A0A239C094_9FIRM|nr:anti-sigma factor domain-containing protein [Anaerovirgula multivorans]SNS13081.1 Anti-sigma factor N-terminus [Anaerovirgula multivorans]